MTRQQRIRRETLLWGATLAGLIGTGCLPIPVTSQADRARATEGKITMQAMMRAQQAQYLDMETFAQTVDALGLGISTDGSSYYRYEIVDVDDSKVLITAQAQIEDIPNFTAGAFIDADSASLPKTIVCEVDANAEGLSLPQMTDGGILVCGQDSQTVE